MRVKVGAEDVCRRKIASTTEIALIAIISILAACSFSGCAQSADTSGGQHLDRGDGGQQVDADAGAGESIKDSGSSTTNEAGISSSACVTGTSSGGSVYYMSPSGDDSATGAKSTPWASFQGAFDKGLKAGDTLCLRGGTYTNVQRVTGSGKSGNYITFKNYDGETPVFDLTNKDLSSSSIIFLYEVAYIVIDGLEIRNGSGKIARGITAEGAKITNITIKNCHIHHLSSSSYGAPIGITSINAAAVNIRVENNYLHDNSTGTSESIHLAGDIKDSYVLNNTIVDDSNIAILVAGNYYGYGQNDNVIVKGNTITDVGTNNLVNPPSIYVDGAKNCIVEYNTINGGAVGIAITAEQPGAAVSGNIIKFNTISNPIKNGMQLGTYLPGVATVTGNTITSNRMTVSANIALINYYKASDMTLSNNIMTCGADSASYIINFTDSADSLVSSQIKFNNNYLFKTGATASSGDTFNFQGTGMTLTTFQTAVGGSGNNINVAAPDLNTGSGK